jgi:flagellar biosynthesis/type III secretory pathway M-ring protein FliF/YscJ
MDVIRHQLQRMQEQLGGLTASQKMLTASLVAIMVMTMLWWARYAGTAEMVPLLDQSITGDDAVRLSQALRTAGIEAKLTGDRVMVPAEKHDDAIAIAGYARALPADSESGFDKMIKLIGPFETEQKTSAMFNRAREMTLAKMMLAWPGVAKADVMISGESRRRIGGAGDIEPSAVVTLATRSAVGGGELNHKRLAESASYTISSTVAGLKPTRVSVIIDGMRQRTRDDNQDFGGELFEQIAQAEQRFADQLREALPPNARVIVKATINTISSDEVKETYDPKGTIQKETRIDQESSESTAAGSGAAEPGAQANVGIAGDTSAGSAAAGGTTTTEHTKTEMQNYVGKSVETLHKPAGEPKALSAVVRIPMSYFVSRYRSSIGGGGGGGAGASSAGKDPDERALQPLIEREVADVRDMVKKATKLNDDAVSVGTYWEDVPLLAAAGETAAGGAGGAGTGVGAIVTSHVKEIAVGALAVLSLFMVTMMMRRGAPVPVIAPTPELSEAPALASGEDVAGEVGEGGSMLDGMELDEDAIKAQQMLDQVATLVQENPDGAANLVKRWLNK